MEAPLAFFSSKIFVFNVVAFYESKYFLIRRGETLFLRGGRRARCPVATSCLQQTVESDSELMLSRTPNTANHVSWFIKKESNLYHKESVSRFIGQKKPKSNRFSILGSRNWHSTIPNSEGSLRRDRQLSQRLESQNKIFQLIFPPFSFNPLSNPQSSRFPFSSDLNRRYHWLV